MMQYKIHYALSIVTFTVVTGVLAGGVSPQGQRMIDTFAKSIAREQGCDVQSQDFVEGDINGDNETDIAASYALEGCGGGNNAHSEVVVFLKRESEWHLERRTELEGHATGTVKAIKEGVIEVETHEYGPTDPRCCPSIAKRIAFRLKAGRLVKTNTSPRMAATGRSSSTLTAALKRDLEAGLLCKKLEPEVLKEKLEAAEVISESTAYEVDDEIQRFPLAASESIFGLPVSEILLGGHSASSFQAVGVTVEQPVAKVRKQIMKTRGHLGKEQGGAESGLIVNPRKQNAADLLCFFISDY